ncbi:protein translocase SEC61 complex subunit gamma [Candidatus Woesearchaeota archaeon]|nr:protein translocase SEC61 complex subunit gamma [Candidatus Woesearchaeota archaeon]
MEQQNTASWAYKFKSFTRECLRVLKVTRKPDAIEFKTIVKVSGLGILIIGLIGFIVQMIKLLFFK